ncbi:hypothetical protein [Amphritea sp.]|uniref:hypothetical protein n=1 Tax=Amphritea sp. TaxID=1872502 RepID=UPI003D0D6027
MIKKLVRFFCVSLVIITCVGCGEDMTVFERKPFFSISVEGHGAAYAVLMNGLTVYRSIDREIQVSTKIHVNHLIVSGDNEIKILVYRDEDTGTMPEGAKVAVNLMLRDFDDKDSKAVFGLGFENGHYYSSREPGNYSTVNFDKSDDGKLIVKELDVKEDDVWKKIEFASVNAEFNTSLPRWAFENGDDLPVYTSLGRDGFNQERDRLMPLYEEIQAKISAQDWGWIKDKFAERNREYDLALYRAPGETEKLLIKSFKNVSNPDVATPLSLKKSDGSGKYWGAMDVTMRESKFMRMTSRSKGAMLFYNFKDGSGSEYFDVVFRRQGDQWIITR